METNTTQKSAVTLNLSAAEISRLIDIVNDKSDALFDRITSVDKIAEKATEPSDRNAAKTRVAGLTEALRFWDGIERQLKATHQEARDAESSE